MEEPRDVAQASQDENWLKAMHDELDQNKKNHTWELVPRLANKNLIRTKWVLKNKRNDHGEVVRNKERLV